MKTLLLQDRPREMILGPGLSERGFEVVSCRTVAEGQALCAREYYPLIVVDLERMVEAHEVCRALRKRHPSRQSFILLGVDPEPRAWVELFSVGADDLLPR